MNDHNFHFAGEYAFWQRLRTFEQAPPDTADVLFVPVMMTQAFTTYRKLKNGRAAMIAMASLFAWKSIPGSVPLMDVFT